MHLKPSFRTLLTSLSLLVFLIIFSSGMLADDKHKSEPAAAPKAPPPKPANTAHPSGGGNAGHPAPASTGRPGGNANSGRPGGNASNGRPGNTGASSGTGRPGNTNASAANGRPGTGSSNNRNTGANSGAGNSGRNTGNNNNNRNANSNSNSNNRNNGNNSNNKTIINNKTTINVNNHRAPVRTESHVGGHTIARDNRGHVRDIHNVHDSHGREMAIHRDFRGGSRFETRRPGGGRIVGYGRGRGFAERRYYARGGRVYYQRTYVYGGRRYAYAYRYYPYHGVYYYGYAPAFYYHPVFYGWAYNPWAAPVYYNWGWAGNPWFVGYNYYFTPYPVYPTASLWLTDYLIAENLKAAYEVQAQAQADANAAVASQGGGQVALSPEVKQMIAEEVQRQLAEERAAAAQPQAATAPVPQGGNAEAGAEETPAALDPNQSVFVVASNLDLAGDNGECIVTAGDVLMRMGTAPDENNKIAVKIVSSKQGDCAVNTNSDVEVTELQEMHNHFREQLDNGLKTLADNSGKNGLPKAPDTATTGGEVAAPTPDAGADADLQDQEKSAGQAEQEVQKASPGGGK
jgi:hypothetical protein